MPENAAVHIKISGKDYKLIAGPDQKAHLLKAADIVNACVEKYKSSSSVSMSGDALALCAVELAMRLLTSHRQEEKSDNKEVISFLEQLHHTVSQYLIQNCQTS